MIINKGAMRTHRVPLGLGTTSPTPNITPQRRNAGGLTLKQCRNHREEDPTHIAQMPWKNLHGKSRKKAVASRRRNSALGMRAGAVPRKRMKKSNTAGGATEFTSRSRPSLATSKRSLCTQKSQMYLSNATRQEGCVKPAATRRFTSPPDAAQPHWSRPGRHPGPR